ncbi:MAG: HAMP domain-containing histidine kinase [Thermoflexales bacterium]|nr:HAMP domain-containing histidine kinase [Thermoflexales bacterium]
MQNRIAVNAYEKTASEWQDLQDLKGAFVRNVEHELRTPLSIIQGYAKLLHDQELGPLMPEQAHALSSILGQAEKMRVLVERMGVLLAVEGGTSVSIPISLRGMLSEVLRDQREAATEAGVTLEARLEADLPLVAGDPYHLRHVVAYLIESAIKSTPRGGRVWIQAYVEAERIQVTVGDTSAGISASGLAEILIDSKREDGHRYRETNLGLALVKAVVDIHGGQIEGHSQPGLGNQVTLSLPTLSHAVEDLDRLMPVSAGRDGRYAYISRS